MKTAFLSHPDFKLHNNGAGHPERPQRLEAIENALQTANLWDELNHLSFQNAQESDLERCHTPQHIERVKNLAQNGGGYLDGDTFVGKESFEIAKLACGAAMQAVESVWKGEAKNAFVASRPPGHHAESGRDFDSPWGFCLFNHVAVAACFAQNLGAQKVAILDFDVHHGNGTQEIFTADDSVFFASLHQSPLFPGSGAASEIGIGRGEGFTLNFPLRAGSDGAIYRAAWEKVGDATRAFGPDLILISAGFDAHKRDPLGSMDLTTPDFAALVSSAKNWADELCGGKLVAVLEGGYDLTALGESVATTIEVLQS